MIFSNLFRSTSAWTLVGWEGFGVNVDEVMASKPNVAVALIELRACLGFVENNCFHKLLEAALSKR
jgi:hypothetical protein